MSQRAEQNDKVMKLKREKNVRKLNDRSMRFKIAFTEILGKENKVERSNPSNYMPVNSVKIYLNTDNQNKFILRHIVKLQNARVKDLTSF